MNINDVWTVARVSRLTALWAAGMSATQIAADLGCFSHCDDGGRSAVCGKIMRLKLPSRAKASASRPERRKRTEPKQPAAPHLTQPATRLRNGYDPSLKRNPSHNILASIAIAGTEPGLPERLEEPAVGVGLQLIDLESVNCRWPFGHPNTDRFYFCGSVGADYPKQPYCAFHTRKAAGDSVNRKRFEGAALFAAN